MRFSCHGFAGLRIKPQNGACIDNEPIKRVPHGLHRVRRGWKFILDSCGCPSSYHEMLHAELGHEPQSLFELEFFCCRDSAHTN